MKKKISTLRYVHLIDGFESIKSSVWTGADKTSETDEKSMKLLCENGPPIYIEIKWYAKHFDSIQ